MCAKRISVLLGRRRPRVILFVSLGSLLLLGVVVFRGCFPSHPQFGPIYDVTAMELDNEPGRSKVAEFLRKNLPRRILQSPYFPERYKNDLARYVDLGEAQLYWSVGGTNSGWLYFWGRGAYGGLAHDKWEFAPCIETDLRRVTEFPAVFYGSRDPALTNVFGESASTNAIKVSDGQIVFARWVPEPKLMFLFRFGERHDDQVRIKYCLEDRR